MADIGYGDGKNTMGSKEKIATGAKGQSYN
jgi:hypothetical protein